MQAQKIQPKQQPEAEELAKLYEVSLFSNVRNIPGALEELDKYMTSKFYEPDGMIIKEGETGSEMYILVEGQASVYKSTLEGELYKVAILASEQHAFFGEGGVLDNDPRSATIKADTRCRCLVLEREAFKNFCRSYPQWGLPVLLSIARAVMSRLRKSNTDLTLLYNALVAEIRGH